MKLYKYCRILGVITVSAIATVSIGASISPNKKVHEEIYTVMPEDNLWRIASKYSTDEDNIQEFIYEIKKDNPHIGNYLQVGQKLVIKKELADIAVSTNSAKIAKQYGLSGKKSNEILNQK